MKKINGLFILILILSALAGGLIFWRLFLYQPPAPTEIPLPTPTPTQFILLSPTPPQEGRGDSPVELLRSLKEKFPLVDFLPYETDKFSIDYQSPLSLEVRIKNASQLTQIKSEVLDWIWSKGINPATHQINWLTPAP